MTGGLQDEFLQTLRATFKVEAAEHLQAIADDPDADIQRGLAH